MLSLYFYCKQKSKQLRISATPVYYSTQILLKISPNSHSILYPPHSQTPKTNAITVLFLEFPDLQLRHNQMFDSLYIVGSCRFRLYFFSHRDFAIPLFHLTFDPSVPYFAILLYVANPAPPPPPAPPATSPALTTQVVPDLPLSSDSYPSEATDSPSSSSGPDANYTLVGPDMAKRFSN